MKNKTLLAIGILSIFLLPLVIAVNSTPAIPGAVSLRCGEVYNEHFVLASDNVTITPGTITSTSIGYSMGLTYHPGTKWLHISFFPTSACNPGVSTFNFDVNGETVEINLEVVEDLWNLFGDEDEEQIIFENEKLNIGSSISMSVIEVGDVVKYKLTGCGAGYSREVIDISASKEYECDGEKVIINLIRTFPSINAASFKVFASENWLTSIVESNETPTGNTECVLGLDTLGAKVKRGNIFAIKTINANTGRYVPQVAVTILDQQGELSPISGESSNIGFFSERLHEDYVQDLIVQLEKEGCEPSTQVILFEKSYDDYKTEKRQQEEAYDLVLNITGEYELNSQLSNNVKNALDESIAEAIIRVTKPDNSYVDIKTDANGAFSVTLDQVGTWKLQASKDDYTPSQVSEINVYELKEYLVKVKVNGNYNFEKYHTGDRISFEL